MAMTFTVDQSGDSATIVALAGGWWLIGGRLTFSGSYATGGETLNLQKLMAGPGGTIRRVVAMGNYRGLMPEFDKVNGKLKLWVPTAPATVAEHTAVAYDSDLTASDVDASFLVKLG
jgi:hypothetical protein